MSISMNIASLSKSMAVRAVLALLLCVLTLSGFSGTGQAASDTIDLSKLPKVQDFGMTKDYTDSSALIKYEGANKENLISYEMRLPETWIENAQGDAAEEVKNKLMKLRDNSVGDKAVITPINDSVLTLLGKYTGPPKNLVRSYATVEAQGLVYEVSALHWMVNFVIGNGFTLTAVTEHSSRHVDGLYVQMAADQTYAVLVRVFINGNRVVMARYYLPQENYDEEKEEQWMAISSFKLLNSSGQKIEQQDTYAFMDQVYFDYPVSWTLEKQPILSIERMFATLFLKNQNRNSVVLNAHIRVNAISKLLGTTLAQEVEKFKNGVTIKDYKIGGLMENMDVKYNSSIKYGKSQIYHLIPDDQVNSRNYEFFMTIMEGENYYYFVTMVGPTRENDFFAWARNIETYKIILHSLRSTPKLMDVGGVSSPAAALPERPTDSKIPLKP